MNFLSNHALFEMQLLDNYRVGYDIIAPRPTNSAIYELIWVTEGNGTVLVDMDSVAVCSNTMYFLRSGHLKHVELGSDINGYRIAFSREFLASPSNTIALPSLLSYADNGKSWHAVNIDNKDRLDLERILMLIRDEYECDQNLRIEVLQGCLKIVIAYFSRLADMSAPNRSIGNDQTVFNAFISMVEKQFHMRKMVSYYAGELNVSANYLSEIVRRVTGYSAGYHIRRRVISEAKRMALNTDLPVKQIAFELGFEDSSTFSKFFKAEVGANFTEFRNYPMR